MYRMKTQERCTKRMVKRGYYKNNKSLNLQNDFERSYFGYENAPFKEEVD